MTKKKKNKEHLAHFHIAGFTYYDGVEAWPKHKMGKELDLELDEENKYDPRAIQVNLGDLKLGYLPKSENRIFYKILKVGLGDHITCRVQQLDKKEHPEEQVGVVCHMM